MNRTKIETYDYTWNPLGWGCYGPTGTPECPAVCSYCYAKRNARRGMTTCPKCKAFEPHFHPERLGEPQRVKKPSRVFVCSTSDLFGEGVEIPWRRHVWRAMVLARWHQFFVLTKRPAAAHAVPLIWPGFPPHNVWFGMTITNQGDFNHRMDHFNDVDAKHKFISFEPLQGPVRFLSIDIPTVEWAIIGAETGSGARPPERSWAEWLTKDCEDAGIPVFHKNSLASMGFTRRDMP